MEDVKKVGFFEESPGVKSSDRLMSFLSLCTALVISVSAVFRKDITLGDSLPLVITLLSYAAGQKIFGKAIERFPNSIKK